jgi:hypothetical protein
VVDESWVLPVVIKFDGKPVVTADGHIVYQFEVTMIDSWVAYKYNSKETEINFDFLRLFYLF